MNTTVQTLKGFRDFLPQQKRARDFVAQKVTETFQRFGFEPLETPTLEYASLLLGKYGDEADKLVYSFTDRGDREVALRYDQTVPTARVLAQYQNELPKYFRRYQIQNVFRADKPQKGRFREFTQCDLDIFGSRDAVADAEILAATYASFTNVGFQKIELRVNDRQLLMSTLQPFATPAVTVFSIIQSIDKLDKLPASAVIAELSQKGLDSQQAQKALDALTELQPSGELQQIIERAQALGVPQSSLVFTPTLARGLDYYTGMIFEVVLPEYPVGSCGGGGRYDKLIDQLSGVDIPAVGVGMGFDRMVEAALELGLVPNVSESAEVLVTLFDESTLSKSLAAAAKLRDAGIRTEVYPALDKLGKQFKTADQKNIPFALIIGEEELSQNKVQLKNLQDGTQQLLSIEECIALLKSEQNIGS